MNAGMEMPLLTQFVETWPVVSAVGLVLAILAVLHLSDRRAGARSSDTGPGARSGPSDGLFADWGGGRSGGDAHSGRGGSCGDGGGDGGSGGGAD
jgi:hypothetical protein